MIIVYSYYVLDIVHKGHLEMLRNAKAVAGRDGRLIVGILTDEAAQEKKPKPIMSFEERIELARSIEYVDLVVSQDTYSPLKNITSLQPDILMESSNHTAEPEVVKAMHRMGGRILRIPYFPDHSSSQIKEQVSDRHS